ncbi:ATP-binding protein [Streptomyces sp. NPDC005301]|uniref:ATP-binding protein n=1 Tax=Streptomyces sp. NPDC005301 TaxID=3156874 RepID=UPI00339DF0A8
MASVTPSAPLGTDAAADRFGLRAAAGVRPDATAERRFRFELAAHPGSVRQARHLTHARLSGWQVCADTCDTADLVVSELVTNAIVHTASRRIVCELHDADDLVRIAVRDEGCAPGEPRPSPQGAEDEHGRGLMLVAAVCQAWGAQEYGPGLLVWAELPRTPDADPTAALADAMGFADLADATGEIFEADAADTVDTMESLPRLPHPAPVPYASGRPDAADQPFPSVPARSGGREPDTEASSDLGWSAKKPPADGRGSGAQAFRGTGAEWV